MLQIRLLGQFDIRLNGKPITISSRAGQSLLAYLALTAGTSHRRPHRPLTFILQLAKLPYLPHAHVRITDDP